MKGANFWVALVLFLVALAAFIWIIWKVAKDPKNANREIGFTLIRLGVTYNLSALLLLQLMANLAEAGIVGSLQHEGINVGARMWAHLVIAVAGIIAALTWIKATREFFASFVLDVHWGKRLALVCLTFMIAAIAFVGSIAAPLANMFAVANAANQTVQLDLFVASLQYDLFGNPAYLEKLAIVGLPLTYSPWGALKNEMVTSILLTSFHMLITIWDVLLALKLSLTKTDMEDAFDTDLVDTPQSKGQGGNNNQGQNQGQGQNQNNTNQNQNQSPTSKFIKEFLEIVWPAMDGSALDRWTDDLAKLARKGSTQDQGDFAAKIADFHRKATYFKENGKGPGGENQEAIGKEISDYINDKSKGKLTLPKAKPKK